MRSSSIKELISLFICKGLRVAECILPLWCLRVLLWPGTAVMACWELACVRPTIRQFDRLPPSLRPPLARRAWIWRIWQRRTEVILAKLLCFWPDRLGEPRWQKHCRCTGMEQFEETWARGRPVVLAVLHFGPLAVLRFWMRARGLPIAALLRRKSKDRPLHQRYLDRICDHVGGVPGLRHVFGRDELREVSQFLQSRRLLIVAVDGNAVDGNAAKHVLAEGDDFHLRMATGALRLAAHECQRSTVLDTRGPIPGLYHSFRQARSCGVGGR